MAGNNFNIIFSFSNFQLNFSSHFKCHVYSGVNLSFAQSNAVLVWSTVIRAHN